MVLAYQKFSPLKRFWNLKERYMASNLRRLQSTSESDPEVVDAVSRVADYLADGSATRIVVLTGAGLSTASGIPDFRTPGSGLYDNLTKYNLPWPEAVFDLDYFKRHPLPFYTLAKELYPSGRHRPNTGHYFLRLLHEKRRLLRVYTQNIDGLERVAGLPLDKVVEAHGTFTTASCIKCSSRVLPTVVKMALKTGSVPRCKTCNGLIKPDIVFFGENLPDRFWTYRNDLKEADLVLVMGTSLEVYPFAELPDTAPEHVPRVLLNRQLVGSFESDPRTQDVAILGDITESINRLVRSLNWHDELAKLMKNNELDTHLYDDLHSNKTSKSNSSRTPDNPLRTNIDRLSVQLKQTLHVSTPDNNSSGSETHSPTVRTGSPEMHLRLTPPRIVTSD